MDLAIQRASSGGGLNASGSSPLVADELSVSRVPEGYKPSSLDFIVPIFSLIGIAFFSYAFTGTVRIAEAFGLAVVIAVILAWIRGLPLQEIISGLLDGCKGVTSGAILLGLAVTLGTVSRLSLIHI